MAQGQIAYGTYTGAAAAQNISVGFVPGFVMVINKTDGTPVGIWTEDMADGTALDIAAAAASNAAAGITPYAGSSTAGAGFTVGTDYAANAKVSVYVAIGKM